MLFLSYGKGLLGPFDVTGNGGLQEITFRHGMDHIVPEVSMLYYHEKGVDHEEIDADVKVSLLNGFLSPAPTSAWTGRYQFSAYYLLGNYWYKTTSYVDGEVVDRLSGCDLSTGYYFNRYWRQTSSNSFSLYELSVGSSTPSKVSSFTRKDIVVGKVISGKFRLDITTHSFNVVPSYTGATWNTAQSADTWDTLIALGKENLNVIVHSSSDAYQMKTGATPELSVRSLKEFLDAKIVENLCIPDDDLPFEEINFGDLAQNAVEQVNANHVNMISFLRDLREPSAMIPKLRNLANLKNLANDYLSVNYGLLPTISDIQGILAAFQHHKPILDRNGFKTYHAGHTDQGKTGNTTVDLSQYVKIAIDDNDSMLYSLMNELDSWGFYPTFENIWDLIPYSFVVDWLLGVGDFLERIDTRLRVLRLGIRYVTLSRKLNYRYDIVPDSQSPYSGFIERVHYHRWVSDQCPVPPLSLQTTFKDFSHWLESAALIVQRKKH
jgi:hypothetical protein